MTASSSSSTVLSCCLETGCCHVCTSATACRGKGNQAQCCSSPQLAALDYSWGDAVAAAHTELAFITHSWFSSAQS